MTEIQSQQLPNDETLSTVFSKENLYEEDLVFFDRISSESEVLDSTGLQQLINQTNDKKLLGTSQSVQSKFI